MDVQGQPAQERSFFAKMSTKERYIFFIGLLYLISPVDIVPEALLGPIGLLDDGGVLIGLLRLAWNVNRRP